MDVYDAMKKRRSIRKYRKERIPKDTLDRLLECARIAPSGRNLQPWELVVVTDDETRKNLIPACGGQEFIADASAFIAGVDDPGAKWYRVDLAIAMEHIALGAVELGLGTCYIGRFSPDDVKQMLGVPDGKVVTVCMVVGYPGENPPPKDKKPLSDIVHWEKYRQAEKGG